MDFESILLAPLELWAGPECTICRVQDRYFHQLESTGHIQRLDDLNRFAELGIRTLRYPILWEQIAPEGVKSARWEWADERLKQLQQLNIRPILGLIHHGSGPRYTSLIDPEFPEKFTEYALAVAQRYPWVSHYTPVNEPLTTARFSCLYGHWYPHTRDNLMFARALLNECRAVALGMKAIRRVNPAAQLIQTEDLGQAYSTPLLTYQAEFENQRRWLTFDLLMGRIDQQHPLWAYLTRLGIPPAELQEFVDEPCVPDVIGINHYLTSERFLDERLDRYPAHFHGGNELHAYADVEAIRVCAKGVAGPYTLLKTVWERYGLPMVMTEAHLACTREEQLRWLKEVWDIANALREEQIPIVAITAWHILGSYHWNILMTREDGDYECGAFDVRGPQPRLTALSDLIRHLASGAEYHHPVLGMPGWWHRQERFLYPPHPPIADETPRSIDLKSFTTTQNTLSPKLLITGATGTLGAAFARIASLRGLPFVLLTRQEMDIANPVSVESALDTHKPWAIINTAGYVRLDAAEQEPELCFRENTQGPIILADACAKRGIPLVSFSSDMVFDGKELRPYVETDRTAPLNIYGRSKAKAEERVFNVLTNALIIRTGGFFGPWDVYNFVTLALWKLASGERFVAADDILISPVYVPDLVNATLDLLIDGECGIWHLVNPSSISWADFARQAAALAGLDPSRVQGMPSSTLGLAAPRPSYSVLGSMHGNPLPPLDQALRRYFQEVEVPLG